MDKELQKNIQKAMHKMIKKVTNDLEENRYNTAIAAMMEYVNSLYKFKNCGFQQKRCLAAGFRSCGCLRSAICPAYYR